MAGDEITAVPLILRMNFRRFDKFYKGSAALMELKIQLQNHRKHPLSF